MSADTRHRIQAVAAMTGVPAATLRAWERRYGFPSPRRTTSAYRLYSDHDVELVRRMGSLVSAGVPPSEAARRLAAAPLLASPDDDAAADPYAAAARRITAAARGLDAAAMKNELRRLALLDDGHVAFARVLRPALAEIGALWEAGAITVAHEHLATHLITTTALDLLRTAPVHPDAATILLACFAEELHGLPLVGAALALASWGYRPLLLGARTPPDALGAAVSALRPALVGLSATVVPGPAATTRDLLGAYATACGETPWIVGGAASEELAPLVTARGGSVVPADPTAARALVERVATRSARPRPRTGDTSGG